MHPIQYRASPRPERHPAGHLHEHAVGGAGPPDPADGAEECDSQDHANLIPRAGDIPAVERHRDRGGRQRGEPR